MTPGTRYKITHSRKGTFTGTLVRFDDEWAVFKLEHEAHGLAKAWADGEELTVRRSFIDRMEELSQ